MSLRELIQKKTAVVTTLAVILILVGILSTVYQFFRSSGPTGPLQTVWYSTDDGATWFADAANNMPFERDGKPGYQAYVMDDGLDKPFVAYLERCSPMVEKELKALRGPDGVVPQEKRDAYSRLASMGRQVKRPGQPGSEWAAEFTDAAIRVKSVSARPGSSGVLTIVNP